MFSVQYFDKCNTDVKLCVQACMLNMFSFFLIITKKKKKKKALHAFLEVGNNFYTNYWKYIPAEEREVFEQCENGGEKIGEGVCLRKMCTCAWGSWHSVDSMFVNVLAGF